MNLIYCHFHAQTKECDIKYEEFNRKLTAFFWHLQNYNDRLWPMIIFGSLMFIPGSYHVFLAVQTFRGVPGYLFDEYPTFDWFMVMISIFFFFQNYFLLHWCIVIIHILLARSINQFRNNGFEFSRNFDQFPCFNIAHLTISTIFLTKVNHLSLFSLNEVKLLMLICFLMYDFFIHFLLFWTTISNFLCNLVQFF